MLLSAEEKVPIVLGAKLEKEVQPIEAFWLFGVVAPRPRDHV